jgi:hypothetical protein
LEDENILPLTLTGNESTETSTDSKIPDYQFVTENRDGEYFFGKGYYDNEITENDKIEAIIASCYNRRNDKKYTTPMKKDSIDNDLTSKLINMFYLEAEASSGDFSIDYRWDKKFGWTEYEYTSNYGDVNEWKAFYHYNDGDDDYYAIVGSTYMTPHGWNSSSDHLTIEVDCDKYQTTNKMFAYSPKLAPTSSTYSFSIGAGSNGEAEIGASWDVVVNDLDVSIMGTSSTNEYYKVDFEYDQSSQYSREETNQDWSVIVQRDSGNYVEIYNKRWGYFTGQTLLNTSSCGEAFDSTIYE